MLVVTVLSSLLVGGTRAGCAEGWQLAGDSCYRVSAGEMDWYEAQQVSHGCDESSQTLRRFVASSIFPPSTAGGWAATSPSS